MRLLLFSMLLATSAAFQPPSEVTKRPFTVRDAIESVEFFSSYLNDGVIIPSPDAKRNVVVIRQGILAKNVNVYRLLLLSGGQHGEPPKWAELASFTSSSNRPGIDGVRWLDDKTVTFLGEAEQSTPQVRVLDVDTRSLRTLTHEADVITDYAVSPALDVVAVDVITPIDTTFMIAQGYLADRIRLHSLLHPDGRGAPYAPHALRILRQGEIIHADLSKVHSIRWDPWPTASISPDGRFAVIAFKPREVPQRWWTDIPAARISKAAEVHGPGGNAKGIGDDDHSMLQFHLVNLQTGAIRPLQDMPTTMGISGSAIAAAWSSDSRRVLLANGFLSSATAGAVIVSIDGASPAEKVADFSDHDAADFKSAAWLNDDSIVLRFRTDAAASSEQRTYRRGLRGWRQNGRSAVKPPFVVDEAKDKPPEIGWRTAKNRISPITDFNAGLRKVDLGPVELIRWKDGKDRDNEGGLLMPPGRQDGARVPLVIYTHGVAGDEFWADGPFHGMGYSARALAAKGIAVLQVYDKLYEFSTPGEISSAVDRYAAAVAKLAQKGLIDDRKVGIHTWSRTGFYLLNALLDCRVAYRAASASDADILSRAELTDAYMIPSPGMSDMEGLMGAPLWGDGAKIWAEKEPINFLSEIHTPIRIETTGWRAAWWDAFTLMKRQGRAVEYHSYPDAEHSPVKPLERLRSQEGSVDWYSFWLLGAEDPRVEKVEQYRRWRAMRESSDGVICARK